MALTAGTLLVPGVAGGVPTAHAVENPENCEITFEKPHTVPYSSVMQGSATVKNCTAPNLNGYVRARMLKNGNIVDDDYAQNAIPTTVHVSTGSVVDGRCSTLQVVLHSSSYAKNQDGILRWVASQDEEPLHSRKVQECF